jgi:PAS domain S-box-containing protein
MMKKSFDTSPFGMKEKYSGKWLRSLLQVITEAQQKVMLGQSPRPGFDRLLDGLLELTGSEYGFVGEVLTGDDGALFLRTHSISNIAWNEQTRAFYETYEESGLEFTNLDTLFGHVISSGQPLIANDPGSHPKSSGLPPGHPPLHAFLGLPLHVGDELVGMAGLSNREGGYDKRLLEALGPVVSAAGYMIVVARERTNRIAAEVEASRGELLRDSVVETALDCVIAMDHEGRIIEFNPAAEETFGWSRKEVMGQALAEIIVPPALREAHSDGMAKYMKTGEGPVIGQRIEVPSIRRDGTEFPVELAVTVAELDEHPVFTAYIRDITERRQAEEELKRVGEAAEAASKAKTIFVATVSHEIRTPINAIMGALGLLEAADLEASDQRYLRAAHRSAETLLGLVNDVLDLSRIDADKLPLEIGPTSPTEICDGVMQLLADRAESRGIQIGSVIHGGVPGAVNIDSGKLRQVLINLVGNSIKFTRDGGVRVDLQVEDDRLLFSVTDTGVGISDEDLSNLFTEFAQFGDARERGGAGLGLAISKRLVEMMDGSIDASSTLGEGSCFRFAVPFESPEPAGGQGLTGKKGLVVGRGDFLLTIVRDQLGALGVDCRTTHSAERAADILAGGGTPDFALLLLDAPPSGQAEGTNKAFSALAREKGLPLGLIVSGGEDCARCLEKKLDASMVFPVPVLNEDLTAGIAAMVFGESRADPKWSHSTLTMDASDRGIRVLLADDSQANRLVMGEMVRRSGFDVDVVADGLEAVEALRSLPYHIVLMDIEMPEMDGIEATRQIRGLDGPQAAVPIVALTANVLTDSRDRFLGAGMNDYVSKPVDRQTLVSTILKWANTDDEAGAGRQTEVGSLSVIDGDALVALGEDTSPDLVPRMVEVFVEELRSRAASIMDGLEINDPKRLASEAHALKSSAATYGARIIADHARRIDQACKDGDVLAAESQARELLGVVESTVKALEAHPLANS